MSRKIAVIIVALLTCAYLMTGCSKKEEYQTGEISPKESSQDTSGVVTIKPEPINYDSILVVVSQLVDSIKHNPTNIELRQQLVAVSYDTTWETILAAGAGKPSQDAKTASIAMKFAEQAARADAYRWAVYIKRWAIDPTFPNIEKLDVEIPGSRVVAKKVLPDQTVTVLIEVKSTQIL